MFKLIIMTFTQAIKHPRTFKQHSTSMRRLKNCPAKKGVCIKVRIHKPKKPNSASRKVAKMKIISTQKNVLAYIPGQGHSLKNYSVALISGGRANDLPGVRFSLVRG
jgi:small subunit ribosomal protein S12